MLQEQVQELSQPQDQWVWADQYVDLSKSIVKSGKYNFQGCHVPLPTHWNVELFKQLAGPQFPDPDIFQFITFGWPISRDRNAPYPVQADINHKGALNFPQQVDEKCTKVRGEWKFPFDIL